MATENDLLANQISQVTSLSELEPFQPRLKGILTLQLIYDLKRNELVEKEKGQVEKKKRQVAEAKLRGSYYESADELWAISQEQLVHPDQRGNRGQVLNRLFKNIARSTRPSCYTSNNVSCTVYQPPTFKKSIRLPGFHNASVGTNSLIVLQSKDILGNPFSKERAHNAPDSVTCLPSWGHAVEGALGEVTRPQKMEKRLRLAMGTDLKQGKDGFRYSPFNFIRFSAHKEYYDTAPHVLFLPIMTVDDIKDWNGTPYSVLVIACDFGGTAASDVYKGIIRDENAGEGTQDDIITATTSLKAFMKGLAASLLQNIPIELAKTANTGKDTELGAVRGDIDTNGLKLPDFDESKNIRPVYKLLFASETNNSVADPWMLLTKASVNLSWKFGQKLLPACKPPAATSEGDRVFWQNMAEFQMAQGESVVPPAEVAVSMPQTPPHNAGVAADVAAASREVVPVVTPETEGDNWEYLT